NGWSRGLEVHSTSGSHHLEQHQNRVMRTPRFAALLLLTVAASCAKAARVFGRRVNGGHAAAPSPEPDGALTRRRGNRLLLYAVGSLLCSALVGAVSAQSLPLEIHQDATHYNLLSTNGLPISITRGTPAGSDGRGPTVAQQQAAGLTTVPATSNQFQTFVTFGSLAMP